VDAIAKDLDCPHACSGTVSHDLDVVSPIEFVVEKETEITYNVRGDHCDVR